MGAVGGLLATAPMTAAMVAMHRHLPPGQRYPLPPNPVTRGVLRRLGWPRPPRGSAVDIATTLAAHFGFGALAGAGYPGWRRRMPRAAPLPAGIAYGLAVWGVSYLGWVPGFGLLSPATRHPRPRVALMLAAHVVWGAATAAVAEGLTDAAADPRPPIRRRSR